MRRLNVEEVKAIQIDILEAVAAFCEENQIKYWLNSGTLIGAIRHKGYIPWDDDIDIGMLREEYEKFLKLFNKSNSKYRFDCFELNDEFPYPYGKVFDTDTVLYEPDTNGLKQSINIDVFVIDNAPDDDMEVKKMYKRRHRLRYMFVFSQSKRILPGDPMINRIAKTLVHSLLSVTSSKKYIKKMIENTKRYNNTETKRVGDFTGYAKVVTDRSVFDSFIDVTFEGKQYKAPVGYDVWLKEIYGDYMSLPPVEERITHHRFEAYSSE